MRCADHILFDRYSLFIKIKDFKEKYYEYYKNKRKST